MALLEKGVPFEPITEVSWDGDPTDPTVHSARKVFDFNI